MCPRCKSGDMQFPALSRKDNSTYICSNCGTDEAMFNFAYPGLALLPVTEKVW